MPISERAATGNDIIVLVVTNSLELPYPVNKLQVAHMVTLVSQDTVYEFI